ncbi:MULTISPECIES: hypothetical protein [Halorussus]|uniref:hypothetical protein n=1 Tax=Halorussus TaxID=1070314 RepID=UPI00209EC05C|nr:hypothetical protein [Halorussus vallis]USZ77922.1 hypothetical protein NGM07_22340 [Halorussus vallis]
MDVRRRSVASPLILAGGAVATILLFSLVYPFTGFTSTVGGNTITYQLSDPIAHPEWYLIIVWQKSLHLSVQTFALGGPTNLAPVGASTYLADLETLSGLAFLALFTASLIRE